MDRERTTAAPIGRSPAMTPPIGPQEMRMCAVTFVALCKCALVAYLTFTRRRASEVDDGA